MQNMGREALKAGKQIQAAGRNITSFGSGITSAVTLPLAGLGASSVVSFGKVDKSLKLVKSTMGDAKWAAGDLEGAIKKAASNSVYSMQDAADASLNFARQGFNAQQAAKMLTPALDLAAGTATSLSEVTSGLGNTLKLFGDTGLTAKQAANVFAQAQAQANTSTTELFDAMRNGSSIFKTVGWSMQDLAAVTDVFGDNFISGSEGATAMKTGLARLVSPASDGAKWIKRLNLNFTDANGTMKSMVNVQSDLHNAFSGLTQEQQMQAASAIFGKNQMGKWLTLINTAPKTLQNYRSALDDVSGTASSMSNALLSGVGGSIEKLKSTFDVFKYSVGSLLGDTVKKVIDRVTSMIDVFNNMDEAAQKNIVKFAGIAASIGPAIMAFGKVVTGVGTLEKTFGKAMLKIANAGSLFKAIASPANIAIASIAGIAVAAVLIIKNWDKVKKAFASAGEWISSAFEKAGVDISVFTGTFTSISNSIKSIAGKIIAAFKTLGGAIHKDFAESFGKGAGKAGSLFSKGITVVIKIINNMVKAVDAGLQKADIYINSFSGVLLSAFGTVKTAVKAAMPVVGTVVKAAFEVAKTAINGAIRIFTAAKATFATVAEAVKTAFFAVVAVVKAAMPVIGTVVKAAFEVIKTVVKEAIKVLPAVKAAFTAVAGAVKAVMPIAATAVKTAFFAIKTVVTAVMPIIVQLVKTAFFGIRTVVKTVMPIVGAIVQAAFNAIKAIIKIVMPVIVQLVRAGFNAIKKAANIVRAVAPVVRGAMGIVSSVVKKAFTIVGKVISAAGTVIVPVVKTTFDTVTKVISVAADTIKTVMDNVTKVFNGIITFISGVFTGNWRGVWQGVVDIFGGIFGTLGGMCKGALNAVISVVNGAVSAINKVHIDIPDWVPGIGGKSFGINIPSIPMLYKGTSNWGGGAAVIHDRGGEIVDLPKGTRVYPHDKSVEMARREGTAQGSISINIQKLADRIEVRSDKDIDRIAEALAYKLKMVALNTGTV